LYRWILSRPWRDLAGERAPGERGTSWRENTGVRRPLAKTQRREGCKKESRARRAQDCPAMAGRRADANVAAWWHGRLARVRIMGKMPMPRQARTKSFSCRSLRLCAFALGSSSFFPFANCASAPDGGVRIANFFLDTARSVWYLFFLKNRGGTTEHPTTLSHRGLSSSDKSSL